jgi:putative phage-type endonuclease
MDNLMQGSDEWFEARLGKVTASRISDVVAQTKSGWGASRARYMGELIAETMTKTPTPSYSNSAMQWGLETEPEAADAYAFITDAELEMVGFVNHPKIDRSGCSPDRLIGKDGLVEIKCPLTHTHIETLLNGKVPKKYICQMQWQMACTERKWCDFVSFDPRMPPASQLFIKRVERDEERIKELENMVVEFLTEMNEKIDRLKELENAA